MISRDVAQMNPAAAAAAIKAQTTPAEDNQLEQWTRLTKLDRRFRKMDVEKGRREFQKLDREIQDVMRSVFAQDGVEDYLFDPPNFFQRVASGLADLATSPLTLLGRAVGTYSRAINLPGLQAQQVLAGGPQVDLSKALSRRTLDASWDGRAVFDYDALRKVEENYTPEESFIAKQILMGRTPGEIIAARGELDEAFAQTLSNALGDEERWSEIIDDFERAKLSPGRAVARRLFGVRTGRSATDRPFTFTSALVDAFYQVAIDPLTWATMGGSNLVTKPFHLKRVIGKYGADGINEAFNDPQLIQLWDDVGPKLKELKEARKQNDFARAGNIRRNIAETRKGLDNDEVINLLADSDVVDAASAKDFFRKANNWQRLVSGRVDGADYWRDGVVTTYRTQKQRDWLNTQLAAAAQGRAKEVDAGKLNDLVTGIREMGRLNEGVANLPPHVANSFVEQNRTIQAARRWIARHPGPQAIYWTDDKVAETIPQVRDLVRVLGHDKNTAYATAEYFMSAPQDERIEFLRGAYSAVMQKLGVDNGTIQNVLSQKFFNTRGAGVVGDVPVPTIAQNILRSEVPEQFVKERLEVGGALHYSQETPVVGALPWDDLMYAAATNAFRRGSAASVFDLTNAFFQSKPVSQITDRWNAFNLAVRNGMRTTIDHFAFGLITLPRDVLSQLVNGRRVQSVITAITGSKAAVGPVKSLGYKTGIIKGGPEFITNEMREEIHYAVQGFASTSPAIRAQSEKTLAKYNLSYSAAFQLDSTMYIAQYALDTFGKKLSPDLKQFVLQTVKHNPFVMEGSVQALTSRAANQMSDVKIIGAPISRTNFDKIMEEYADRFGDAWNVFTRQQVMAGNPNNWSVVWRRNTTIRLNGNRVVFDKRDRRRGTLDLGVTFFRHNGLRTEKDFQNAFNEVMDISGFKKEGNIWVVSNRERANKVLSGRSDTSGKRAANVADGAIYSNVVMAQLSDIRTAFHGSVDGFNEKLYNYVTSNAIRKTPVQVFLDMDQKVYNELTEDMLTEPVVNTDFIIEGMENPNDIGKWVSGEQTMFELMDRQATGFYSAPAFWAAKIASSLYWKKSGFHKAYLKELKDQGYSDEAAQEIVERRFEEMTTRDAAGTVIRYIDNPMIRSQISYSIRNVGRYIRATEDFGRRIYRLKNTPLETFYRVRLANQGLEASGVMYEDSDGERYFMFPGDNMLYNTLDRALTFVYGNNEFMRAGRYNEFTAKFSMMNPSLQTDALRPTVASPIAGLAVVAIRDMLGLTNNGRIEGWADNLDELLLGPMGKDATVFDALTPVQLRNIWRILPTEERERQLASSTLSAIAYLFDTGKPLPADADAETRENFLDAVRAASVNVLIQRFFLGMFFPVTPTQQESAAIPDYFKAAGTTNMSQMYQSILQGVFELQKKNDDIDFDPFEQALSIFIRENPGRLVYTIPRSQKTVNIYFQQNEQVKDYIIRNRSFITRYGMDAVLLFAPQMGKFEREAGKWFRQQGLIESKPYADFLAKAQVARLRQQYFDLADERDRLLAGTTNFVDREIIIESIEGQRRTMRQASPMLDESLVKPEINTEVLLYQNIRQISADQAFPMTKMERARLQKMINIFDEVYGTLTRGEMPDEIDYSGFKATEKARAREELRKLAGNDEKFMLINRMVFDPIMNYYSREVPSVGRGN